MVCKCMYKKIALQVLSGDCMLYDTNSHTTWKELQLTPSNRAHGGIDSAQMNQEEWCPPSPVSEDHLLGDWAQARS